MQHHRETRCTPTQPTWTLAAAQPELFASPSPCTLSGEELKARFDWGRSNASTSQPKVREHACCRQACFCQAVGRSPLEFHSRHIARRHMCMRTSTCVCMHTRIHACQHRTAPPPPPLLPPPPPPPPPPFRAGSLESPLEVSPLFGSYRRDYVRFRSGGSEFCRREALQLMVSRQYWLSVFMLFLRPGLGAAAAQHSPLAHASCAAPPPQITAAAEQARVICLLCRSWPVLPLRS